MQKNINFNEHATNVESFLAALFSIIQLYNFLSGNSGYVYYDGVKQGSQSIFSNNSNDIYIGNRFDGCGSGFGGRVYRGDGSDSGGGGVFGGYSCCGCCGGGCGGGSCGG